MMSGENVKEQSRIFEFEGYISLNRLIVAFISLVILGQLDLWLQSILNIHFHFSDFITSFLLLLVPFVFLMIFRAKKGIMRNEDPSYLINNKQIETNLSDTEYALLVLFPLLYVFSACFVVSERLLNLHLWILLAYYVTITVLIFMITYPSPTEINERKKYAIILIIISLPVISVFFGESNLIRDLNNVITLGYCLLFGCPSLNPEATYRAEVFIFNIFLLVGILIYAFKIRKIDDNFSNHLLYFWIISSVFSMLVFPISYVVETINQSLVVYLLIYACVFYLGSNMILYPLKFSEIRYMLTVSVSVAVIVIIASMDISLIFIWFLSIIMFLTFYRLSVSYFLALIMSMVSLPEVILFNPIYELSMRNLFRLSLPIIAFLNLIINQNERQILKLNAEIKNVKENIRAVQKKELLESRLILYLNGLRNRVEKLDQKLSGEIAIGKISLMRRNFFIKILLALLFVIFVIYFPPLILPSLSQKYVFVADLNTPILTIVPFIIVVIFIYLAFKR